METKHLISHRKWATIISYFRPLDNAIISKIDNLLKENKNILLLIKKKEHEEAKEREEIFKKICELYPNETKGKIIISLVPDIESVDII